ncbi:BolA family transcriptional regulator [Acetobacteraceae bacterium]|nr:BolA family transcriptional regulator [Acetobacteraceae bacterium]
MNATDLKPRFKRISKLLTEAFPNDEINIVDESRRHANHMHRIEKQGSAEAVEETHFLITIKSARFNGVSYINRQRMIHDLLRDEFNSGLHSLKLSLSAPKTA